MSGYRGGGPVRSPTEEPLYPNGNLGANSYPSSASRSSNYSHGATNTTGQARTSVLSQHVVPSGSHGGAEGELGPYSALRTRSAASSHSSAGNNNSNNPGSANAANSGMIALIGEKEADDYLHEGDADKRSYAISARGVANALTLIILTLALLMLFAGYPILAAVEEIFDSDLINNLNGTGQVAVFSNLASLIDSDTPEEGRSWTNPLNGDSYHLVFSDEFNVDGRTFWEGDDPFWTAVDLWYAGTGDFEWYTPEMVNTTNGYLMLTMDDRPAHNLNFRSGMVQTWNKFCFQGGYIEWSVIQPGSPETTGYWPAAWLLGNLGRAGYLGSTEGMWPYSYQACDTGILPNQTFNNGTGPEEAVNSQATYAMDNGQISQLPGMRFPACTCPNQGHPGPNRMVGRSAPEIDCIEAQIQERNGRRHSYSSQSLQTAPFDVEYFWRNTSDVLTIFNDSETEINTYVGGPLQEAVSAVSLNPDRGFQDTQNEFVTYGIQYDPDWNADGDGSVTWFIDGKATWTVSGAAVGPSPEMDVGQRTVPTEPMYIIMNLGMSRGFQPVEFTGEYAIHFPAAMLFDYVRVYQQDGGTDRISCDPPDHPTADYIAAHPALYQNNNLTTYAMSGYPEILNELKDGC